MKVEKGLFYSKDHEWLRLEGDRAYIGITDFAQESMGDIVFVELPEVDETYDAEDSFAVVESVKAAADIYIPVSAKVVEVNEALEDEPELINKDAFENYIAIIEDFELEDVKGLMSADEYEAFCESLE